MLTLDCDARILVFSRSPQIKLVFIFFCCKGFSMRAPTVCGNTHTVCPAFVTYLSGHIVILNITTTVSVCIEKSTFKKFLSLDYHWDNFEKNSLLKNFLCKFSSCHIFSARCRILLICSSSSIFYNSYRTILGAQICCWEYMMFALCI